MLQITRRIGESLRIGESIRLTLFAIESGLRVRIAMERKGSYTFSMDLNENVLLGSEVELTLLDINRGTARFGIDAPKAITIMREELIT
jgi:sRNA-binding carbon storage regulator CsrA